MIFLVGKVVCICVMLKVILKYKASSFERMEMYMNKYRVIQSFQTFQADCVGSSPLYEHLVSKIVNDEEMVSFSMHTRKGQPIANMLLGAVHFLLLRGVDHPLRAFYPSIVERPAQVEDIYPQFVDFTNTYRDELISLMQTKYIQTNEVRRCAYLYPLFSTIYADEDTPLALIEIGTSTGVQLFVDSYAYNYGTGRIYGNDQADVQIHSELVGEPAAEMSFVKPLIQRRIGIDLHLNNVTEDEDRAWLEALIWPEHYDRRALFKQATEQMDRSQVELIEGNGITLLKQVAASVPTDEIICLFHTHVANQFPEEDKQQLLEHIEDIGKVRPIYHIYNNMWDGLLHMDVVAPGKRASYIVGKTESHGRSFTWEMEPAKHPYEKIHK